MGRMSQETPTPRADASHGQDVVSDNERAVRRIFELFNRATEGTKGGNFMPPYMGVNRP
jgi:hypothetical protein